MVRTISTFAAMLFAASAAHGGVLRVPEDYVTIYEAVDAAAPGDSVLVGPGTWTERDTRSVNMNGFPVTKRAHAFLKPFLTIIGTAGSGATILQGDAPGAGYSSTILVYGDVAYPGGPVIVEGLTLRGVLGGLYHGVHSTGYGHLTLRDCVVESHSVGVRLRNTNLTLRDSIIRDNDGTGVSGLACGIYSLRVHWDLEGCLFENNVGDWVLKNEDASDLSNTSIRSCRFLNNSAGRIVSLIGQANGIPPQLLVEDCWFEGNVATSIVIGNCLKTSDCAGTVRRNTFVNNQCTAGAVWTLGQYPTDLVENTFVGNDAGGGLCAGVVLGSLVPHGFESNIVAGCRGAPAVCLAGGSVYNPIDGCNVFWDNDSGNFDGYIPQPTDVTADPLFCDPERLDFTLSVLSPCLPGGVPGCGLIGAWDQGCGVIAIEPRSWGQIKGLYRLED